MEMKLQPQMRMYAYCRKFKENWGRCKKISGSFNKELLEEAAGPGISNIQRHDGVWSKFTVPREEHLDRIMSPFGRGSIICSSEYMLPFVLTGTEVEFTMALSNTNSFGHIKSDVVPGDLSEAYLVSFYCSLDKGHDKSQMLGAAPAPFDDLDQFLEGGQTKYRTIWPYIFFNSNHFGKLDSATRESFVKVSIVAMTCGIIGGPEALRKAVSIYTKSQGIAEKYQDWKESEKLTFSLPHYASYWCPYDSKEPTKIARSLV